MKKEFVIRMNCIGFQDFALEAKNEKDAIAQASRLFNCNCTESEFCEVLEINELD